MSYGRKYNNKGFGSFQRNDKPVVKHSGCKYKQGYFARSTGAQSDTPIIYGWNASKKRGMLTFIASPKKDNGKKGAERRDHLTKNENWHLWTVKVTKDNGTKPEFFNGLYDLRTKRLFIPDLAMVANPAKNYFGTYIKRK